LTQATQSTGSANIVTGERWDDDFLTLTDGTRLHYLDVGKGPAVILLHGARGSAVGNWFRTGVGPSLAATNRVIAPDLRGHGLSDVSGEHSHDLFAADVLELMDHLGIERAHIGGYSMGGFITMRLLADQSDRFLSAFFAGSGIPDPSWDGDLPEDKEGPDPDAEAAIAALEARHAARGEEIGNNRFGGGPGRGGPGFGPPPGVHGGGPWHAATQIDLSRIRFPVMAINGEYDRPLARTHRMWRELHDFTNVVLEGKGHLSAIMPGFMPQKFVDAIVRFITGNNS
jgi:pimeloyl-ACP methyl ester carboxylesterase